MLNQCFRSNQQAIRLWLQKGNYYHEYYGYQIYRCKKYMHSSCKRYALVQLIYEYLTFIMNYETQLHSFILLSGVEQIKTLADFGFSENRIVEAILEEEKLEMIALIPNLITGECELKVAHFR